MYETWFSLSKRPFYAPPQTVNYFPNDCLESACEGIARCVQRNAGPGVVIGEHGTGKSMLSMIVMNQFKGDRSVAEISAPGVQTRKELIQTMLFELGLPYVAADEGELRLSLIDYLTSPRAGHQGTLLVVDDAHDLSLELLEQLASLSGLVRDGRWCVDLVMLGTSALEEKLAMAALSSLNQRIAARYYLRPWKFDVTRDYLRHQLSQAGSPLERIFEEAAVQQIHSLTRGIPRLINQLCDHALVLAATGGVRTINDQMIEEAWSDLQQLPRENTNFSIATRSMNDDPVVEFGSLDDEVPVSWEAEQTVPDCEESVATGKRTAAVDQYSHESLRQHPTPSSADTPFDPTDDSGVTAESPIETWRRIFENPVFSASDEPAKPISSVGHSPIHDPADKILDEIERRLLEANSDFSRFSAPATESENQHSHSTNPFCESFVEEEVVINRGDICDVDWTGIQPSVKSQRGAVLVETLRTLENSEHLDESSDDLLTELATDPFGFAQSLRGQYHAHEIHDHRSTEVPSDPSAVWDEDSLNELQSGYATGDLDGLPRCESARFHDRSGGSDPAYGSESIQGVSTSICGSRPASTDHDGQYSSDNSTNSEVVIAMPSAESFRYGDDCGGTSAASSPQAEIRVPSTPRPSAKLQPSSGTTASSQPQRKFSRLFSNLKQK